MLSENSVVGFDPHYTYASDLQTLMEKFAVHNIAMMPIADNLIFEL